jgi:hypothetical protein
MRFRSKIDAWMVLIMLFAAVAVAVVCAAQIKLRGLAAVPMSMVVFIALIGPCVWVLASTYYWFDDAHLRVSCGPLRWRIPLDQIHHIEAARNFASSAALSADRLRIYYGRGKVIFVSPRNKGAFLAELDARRSNISFERTREG